jgi:hypothetical protein
MKYNNLSLYNIMPKLSSRLEKKLLKKLTSSAKLMVKDELSKTRKKSPGKRKTNTSTKRQSKSASHSIKNNYNSLQSILGEFFDLKHIQNMNEGQLKEVFVTLQQGIVTKDISALTKVAGLLKVKNIPEGLDHGQFLKNICSKLSKLFVFYELKEKNIKGGNPFLVAIRILIVISLIIGFGYTLRYTPELASYLFGVNSFYALELDGIDAGLDYFLGYELDIRGQDLAILTEYGKMFVYYYRPVAISIETYLVYTLMRLVQTKSYEENEKVYDELLEYIHDVGKTMEGSLKNMIDNMTYNIFSQSANAKKQQIDDLKKEVGIKATELTTIDIQSRIDFMSNMLKTFNKKAIEDADLTPGDITKYLNDLKRHEELTMEAQKLLKNSESMKKTDNEEDKNKFIQDLSSTTKKIEELDSEMQPARKVIASGGGGRASKRGRKSVEPTPVATPAPTQTPVVDTPAPSQVVDTPPPSSFFSFATQSTPPSPKSGPETSPAENKE